VDEIYKVSAGINFVFSVNNGYNYSIFSTAEEDHLILVSGWVTENLMFDSREWRHSNPALVFTWTVV